VEEGHKVDTGTVEQTWVHGFQRQRVVWAKVVVLDLDHRLSWFVEQLH
jgi:hypothetical protein